MGQKKQSRIEKALNFVSALTKNDYLHIYESLSTFEKIKYSAFLISIYLFKTKII